MTVLLHSKFRGGQGTFLMRINLTALNLIDMVGRELPEGDLLDSPPLNIPKGGKNK